MKVQEEIITPETAKSWLLKNVHNRPLRDGLVTTYATDMANEQWQSNGESIKFSSEGELLDGQHRLAAVIFGK